MEEKKSSKFILGLITGIVAMALLKQFDFETLTFKKLGLSVLYIIVLTVSIYLLLKKAKEK